MKRNPVIRVTKAPDSVTLTSAAGESITIRMNDLPDDTFRYAAVHGITQKLVDKAAMSRDPDTGKAATVEEKWAAVAAEAKRLLAGGPWNLAREAGPKGGILFAALCRMYGDTKTPEAIREWLDGKTKAEQAALRTNPKVRSHIDAIEAERGRDVDTDGLLDELTVE